MEYFQFWKNITAGQGYHFILTEKGYATMPDVERYDSRIGNPVMGYERTVPMEWVLKGWVREVAM